MFKYLNWCINVELFYVRRMMSFIFLMCVMVVIVSFKYFVLKGMNLWYMFYYVFDLVKSYVWLLYIFWSLIMLLNIDYIKYILVEYLGIIVYIKWRLIWIM